MLPLIDKKMTFTTQGFQIKIFTKIIYIAFFFSANTFYLTLQRIKLRVELNANPMKH